jgi:hypothetical protein
MDLTFREATIEPHMGAVGRGRPCPYLDIGRKLYVIDVCPVPPASRRLILAPHESGERGPLGEAYSFTSRFQMSTAETTRKIAA